LSCLSFDLRFTAPDNSFLTLYKYLAADYPFITVVYICCIHLLCILVYKQILDLNTYHYRIIFVQNKHFYSHCGRLTFLSWSTTNSLGRGHLTARPCHYCFLWNTGLSTDIFFSSGVSNCTWWQKHAHAASNRTSVFSDNRRCRVDSLRRCNAWWIGVWFYCEVSETFFIQKLIYISTFIQLVKSWDINTNYKISN